MKKLALVLGVLAALLLVSAVTAAPPVPQSLDYLDIGDATSESGHDLWGWGPIEPAASGGAYGGIDDCKCIWDASDDDPTATLKMDTGGLGFARHIRLHALDGLADDSFNIYVKNPGGEWALVYTYTDPAPARDPETWMEHDICSFPAGKGQGTTIEMKFEATGPKWDGFNRYGQVCFDWIEVYDH
jgi:hypothetical protein